MIHFQSESLSSIIVVWLLQFVIFENIVRMSPLLSLEYEDGNIFDRLNNEDVYDEKNE